MSEHLSFIELLDSNNTVVGSKLFVNFRNDSTVYLSLTSGTLSYECQESNYLESLATILSQLPEGYKMKHQNRVAVTSGKGNQLVDITEFVSLTYLSSVDDKVLKFELRCLFDGNMYSVDSTEDFSIALQKLKNKMNVDFNICAFCENGDFMSTGGEDLRHGWYCLREVIPRKRLLPWFEREDEFKKAIPNLSAFHWCPKFSLSDKEFI
ncbi:hypothetical protein [Paenibacillus rigui]|uniref:Uncharacterized protein n=1 Tax=Paenibacillus rigui TaxID=554312 RepID=A0A229UVR6_9BACL|nr:hypothetical protein [Paenibacillus rigui]OXM87391.1 hypothetical protein CF651_04600 [Paenibacillus rigui]